jgi:GT2 family glycosyltransferase
MWPRPKSSFWKRFFAATKPLQRALVKAVPNLRALEATLFSPGDYLQRYPELADSGFLPALDYLLFGAAEERDPHRLFDTDFYFDQAPPISRRGRNPVLHYLGRGVAARRDPHPLFSTSHYLDSNPDVLWSRRNPLYHFIHWGSAEGRSPSPLFDVRAYLHRNPSAASKDVDALSHYLMNWEKVEFEPFFLFDTEFYLETNPDVERDRANPLYHFMRFGFLEGRNPHALFDIAYYLTENRDLQKTGINPLVHFAVSGNRENRRTHPLFDPEFYLSSQPELLTSDTPALSHFVNKGLRHDLPGSADFDPLYYSRLYPDVAPSGFAPLIHYIRFGAAEGRSIRSPRFEAGIPENLFPESSRLDLRLPPVAVDVIVPVYKGLEETRACLESVLASGNYLDVHVVAINDASPEAELSDYLRTLAQQGQIELIEHASNRGFVATANEGMALHEHRDVVLLNSDTEVFGDWVDRLARHAYSGRVGSVTPFSNNATICSYPRFCEPNPAPSHEDAQKLDALMSRVNAGRHCRIPTGVGFCMYIRRSCLKEVGNFDVNSFPRGYGEENDFCMRATGHGWQHLLAADLFVSHRGAVSFGRDADLLESALRAVLDKHPRYLDHVRWHTKIDRANAFRIAATAERIRQLGVPVWLSVLHKHGGGTEEHVNRLEADTAGRVFWVRVYPAEDSHLRLSCEVQGYEFSVALHSKIEYELLLRLLESLGVSRIHVHHSIDVPLDIQKLACDLDVPYDLTIHDYFLVCPKITLTDKNGRYCGEQPCRDRRGCDRVARQRKLAADVQAWRAKNEPLVRNASRVIAPSLDAASRIQSYFPSAEIIAAWHEEKSAPVLVSELDGHEKLRVAVLGNMNLHKGFANLKEVSQLASQRAVPLDFRLIGGVTPELSSEKLHFAITGKYKPNQLPELLSAYAPHLVWFPCQWPETFSYTLSTCMELGLPVAAPDLGAFPERLAGREWTWILPWETDPRAWLDFFLEIRENNFARGAGPVRRPEAVAGAEADFYPERFLKPAVRQGEYVVDLIQ